MCKAPFEKIIIITSINDMEKYIKNNFLFIKADEIMTIFLLIMIKSQMFEKIFC